VKDAIRRKILTPHPDIAIYYIFR